MQSSFKEAIEKYKSILILLPVDPVFDEVASSLALYLTLKKNKSVQVLSPTPMIVEFNYLVSVNEIVQELGNKNLVISFNDYKANDIDKVTWDIENGQFKLVVSPVQGANPPSKEQIKFYYSGVLADLLILIGGKSISDFPILSSKELSGVDIFHISTRNFLPSPNRSYYPFVKDASSISELVAYILKENGFSFDEDISTNLLMGIENQTENFSTPQTSAETFAIVSELMKFGGRRMSSFNKSAPPQAKQEVPTSSFFVKPTQPWEKTPRALEDEYVETESIVRNEGVKSKDESEAPLDWLKPKIFKGTSTK